jgi:integrase
MKSIEKKVGFPVRAHMLRHTYGTYTLSALRKSSEFEGEPLLYVRDRMGHSDVQTTAIYLHLINQLDAQIVLAHEDELDRLFAATGHGEMARRIQ